MSKFTLLLGFGAGYVLGARAGRERYDQIVAQAQRVWRDPRVQQRAEQAQDVLGEKAAEAASAVGEKAAQAASAAQGAVKERLPGSGSESSGSDGPGSNGSGAHAAAAEPDPRAPTAG